MKKLGLIVNPIAGMGGKVGLKGTDGLDVLEKARELGAVPEAPQKAVNVLKIIAASPKKIEIITCPAEMGENEAREAGFEPVVLDCVGKKSTTAEDTERAAREMLDEGIDLLLFAGGDGTARNIYNVVEDRLPVIGIPAGVKIHSAVFAINPRNAGELALMYLQGKLPNLREAEVMDIDEAAFREGRISAKLYGYLKVPFEKRFMQSLKVGRGVSEEIALAGAAEHILEGMQEKIYYIIGPGTSTRAIMERLNLKNTLLGVDVVLNKKLAANDVNEAQLLDLIKGKKAKIIVTVIGGQGYVFGRGNQQISAEVIKQVGKTNIIIIASKDKIISLTGRPLLADTGNEEVNNTLEGYIRVITGYKEELIYKIAT
ncbi:MAG: ATP-NAD kinase family protein [Firmicutes bacterium]|nr:ATP-NAD kinase family protein [Bacillota bacterium]